MKLNAREIGPRLDRPDPQIRLYLFHGSDEAGAHALAQRLAKAIGERVERVDLEGAALRSRPGLLAEEAASLSLFGDPRYIRVTSAGDEVLAAVEQLLAAEQAVNPAVIIAPALRGTSKLVKLVTTARNAVAHACYVPEGADAARLARDLAREAGLILTRDAAERLSGASNGDRAILAREIEKLALYLDADPASPREAGADEVAAIGATIDESRVQALGDALIGSDAVAVGNELALIAMEGGGMIGPLRQLVRRFQTLADLRSEVDQGRSIHEVVERSSVFFKEKEGVKAQLSRWDGARIGNALTRLGKLERQLKSSASAGDVLASTELVEMARRTRVR